MVIGSSLLHDIRAAEMTNWDWKRMEMETNGMSDP
jgi:hypothetical protein